MIGRRLTNACDVAPCGEAPAVALRLESRLKPELHKTLTEVSTASIASALLKLGLRNIWIRGATPVAGDGARAVGPAFTLRFLPMREDLTGPALAKLPNTRAAVEARLGGALW